jgi:hypothetical protein
MTTVGDIDSRFVVRPLDLARLVNRVQLGMERSAECVKREFRDFGSDRKHEAIP